MTISRRTALAMIAATAATPAVAAPKARLLSQRWRAFGSLDGPDHGAWDRLLAAVVKTGSDGINRVDYRGADSGAVNAYVSVLTKTDPTTLTSNAAFAYWVNLYNAVTIQVVLSAYPVRSIREIGGGLFKAGPWRKKLVTVGGSPLSLDDIEHGILRPVWRDPRIHYAVNCASLGCPNLAPRAYTASRLSGMLEEGARSFINHPRGADLTSGGLVVSSIYHWFKADFGGSDSGVIAHLGRYANTPKAEGIRTVSRIADHRYDWALNG